MNGYSIWVGQFLGALVSIALVLLPGSSSGQGFSGSSSGALGFAPGDETGREGRTRIALVVGNGDYVDVSPLPNPPNDARDVAVALDALGFEVTLLLDATRSEMLRAVIAFGRQLAEDSIGLFYYAGHAIQVRGENYLVPVTASLEDAEFVTVDAVTLDTVLDRMGNAPGQLNIVVLDACRNNPFRGLYRSVSRGLAPAQAPAGTFIAYSAAPGRVALDGQDGERNSPYARAFLEALREPGLKVEEVFKQVRFEVAERTDRFQIPWTESSLTGDFYFRQPPEVTRPVAPPAPTVAVDAQVFAVIANSDTPGDFEQFIRDHPNSPLVPYARRRLARLQGSDLPVPGAGPATGQTGDAAGSGGEMVALPSVTEPPMVTRNMFEPGETFSDCAECPDMIVIPPGSFLMGSPSRLGFPDETPQYPVRFSGSFALGRFEVTFAEWDACVAAGGCGGHRPDDQGWGRGRRPVINVSWEDAKAYVAWLNRETGETYRLPTESEWEYSCRAGTSTLFWWGNRISSEAANYGSRVAKTTAVGDYEANPWGLFDCHGNVYEWVEDAWTDSYAGAPRDGSVKATGTAWGRVGRGGSWDDLSVGLRAANRARLDPKGRYPFVGFRVARTL